MDKQELIALAERVNDRLASATRYCLDNPGDAWRKEAAEWATIALALRAIASQEGE